MKTQGCVYIRSVTSTALALLLIGGLLPLTPVAAAVAVQTFQPPVKVLIIGEQDWKPLTQGLQLNAGDEILTEKGGTVDLICEDGSTLHLDEETQLAINELAFSEAQKTRVSRFKLFWGTLVAKAKPVSYKDNVFEVETDSAVAGFKFSSLKIVAKQNDVLGDATCPCTDFFPLEGLFEFQQTGQGHTEIESLLENAPGGGIRFILGNKMTATVAVDPALEKERIAVKSSFALPNMRVLLSDLRNTIQIENAIKAPTITVGFQNFQIKVEQDSVVTLGFAPSQAEQEINVGAEGIDGVFIFGRNPNLPTDKLYVAPEKGHISLDDRELNPGSSESLPFEQETGMEPAPATSGREQPVVPPAPVEAPRERTGSPVLP